MYYVGLYGEYQLLCEILINVWLYLQVLEKNSNIKFHKNPLSAAQLFHADGRTDMTKLTAAFRIFEIAHKNLFL